MSFNRNNNNSRDKHKRSSYSFKINDGSPICWGWRLTKQGMQTLYARPYSKTKKSQGSSGAEFLNLFVELKTDGVPTIKTSGLFNLSTNRLFIPEFNLLGTPNGGGQTKSGKYVKGAFYKPRNK